MTSSVEEHRKNSQQNREAAAGHGPQPWTFDLALILLLTVVAWAVFLPALHYPFLDWDDQVYVLRNAWLLNLSGTNIGFAFTHPLLACYHPLTVLSYMVDFQFFGYNPAGYRAVNMLFHALACSGLLVLLRRMGANRFVAFCFALFFAVHPLRVESVVWIAERKDVLCGTFYVWGLVFWIVGTRKANDRAAGGWVWLTTAVAFYVLALLSKPMAVSFPFVVLAHDALLARDRMKRRWPVYAGLLLAALVFSLINMKVQEKALAGGLSFLDRLAMAAYAPYHHAVKTLVPIGLSPVYPMDLRPTLNLLPLLVGVIVSLAALAAIVTLAKSRPAVSFGLLACGLALAPVSGIVPFGPAWAADRFSYLPSMLLFAGLAPVASDYVMRTGCRARLAVLAIFLAVVAVNAQITLRIQENWQSSLALWERVTSLYPDSKASQINLLHARYTAGERSPELEAEIAERTKDETRGVGQGLRTGIQFESEEIPLAEKIAIAQEEGPAGLHRLMKTLYEGGHVDDAVEVARMQLEGEEPLRDPLRASAAAVLALAGRYDAAAEAITPVKEPTRDGAKTYGLLAAEALRQGNGSEAETRARKALAILPCQPDAVVVLSDILRAQNRAGEARKILRKARRHPLAEPRTIQFCLGTEALIAEQEGRAEEAAQLMRRAYAPDLLAQLDARGLYEAGWLAEQAERPAVAAKLYDSALAKDPEHLGALVNLAFLHIQAGDSARAEELLERAVTAHPEDEGARRNLETLRRTRAGQPGEN